MHLFIIWKNCLLTTLESPSTLRLQPATLRGTLMDKDMILMMRLANLGKHGGGSTMICKEKAV